MTRRRRDLIRIGLDDLLANRLAYFFLGAARVVVMYAAFSLLGYAIDHRGSFADSTSAGVGMLVGLAVWLGLLTWFVAIGGGRPLRERRQARRHEGRVEGLRRSRGALYVRTAIAATGPTTDDGAAVGGSGGRRTRPFGAGTSMMTSA